MNAEMMAFFCGRPLEQALWLEMDAQCQKRLDTYEIRVSKTQLSLFSKCMFACISHPRKKSQQGMVVSFGLPVRVESPRIWQVSEPYPGRWTHHVLISSSEQLDDELFHWLSAAQSFAKQKKR